MNKRKKDQIQDLIIMTTIGVIVGGGTSFVTGIPFLLSTIGITSICGTISVAQSGLLADTIKKVKKTDKQEVELHPAVDEHIKGQLNKKELTQEKIDEIHARGKITVDEKVKELESMGLCVPGDAIGSAANRCHEFKYNCHECLVDYISNQDEHEPIEFKVCNSFIDEFMVKLNNGEFKKDTCPQVEKSSNVNSEEINSELESYQRLLDSEIIEETSKEEQGPVKKLVPNKK